MVRIGGGVFPEIKEKDYIGDGSYRVDDKVTKVRYFFRLRILPWRLSLYEMKGEGLLWRRLLPRQRHGHQGVKRPSSDTVAGESIVQHGFSHCRVTSVLKPCLTSSCSALRCASTFSSCTTRQQVVVEDESCMHT